MLESLDMDPETVGFLKRLESGSTAMDLLNTRPDRHLIYAALADWITYSQFGFILVKADIYQPRRHKSRPAENLVYLISRSENNMTDTC